MNRQPSLSGAGAGAYYEALRAEIARIAETEMDSVATTPSSGSPGSRAEFPRLELSRPLDGVVMLRATTHEVLCDVLERTSHAPRPAGRLRIEVDPLQI